MAQQTITNGATSHVWGALSQWLPLTNPDVEYWWKLTGPHIAYMMGAAGYPVEAQYNALLFHYHWIVSLALLIDSPSVLSTY